MVIPEEALSTMEELKAALETTKRKLERSREQECAAKQELAAKSEQLADLQRHAERVEEDRIRMLDRAAEAKRRAQQKKAAAQNARARISAVADLDGLDEVSDDDSIDDDDDMGGAREEEKQRTGCALCLYRSILCVRRFRRACGKLRQKLWLLRGDVNWIQSRFGSSVSVYFVYTEFIVNLAVVNAFIWLALFITALHQYASGNSIGPEASANSMLSYIPPAVFRYSTYGNDPDGPYEYVSLLYGFTLLTYLVWCAFNMTASDC